MALSGQKLQKIQNALMSAFIDKVSLEQMLLFGLNTKLIAIAGGGNLNDIIFKLIQTAESQGWVEDLVRAAHKHNPGNPELKAIAQELLNHNPKTPSHRGKISNFITGVPITQPSDFFGREKELKRLFDLLKRRPLQNAAIIGKKRSGKTSLLHYLKNITTTPPENLRPGQKSDWLPQAETYRWVFLDLQDGRSQSRTGMLSYILRSLNMKVPPSCDIDSFMNVMSENLSSPTVILLDEIGVGLKRCPELDDTFWESLRSLASNHTGGNLAFVLASSEKPMELVKETGHSSPFFNIFGYSAYLGALTEREAQELITSSPINFADEDIDWILAKSQRWPLLLQILCRERLFSLENGETDDWRKEGIRQIEPFRHLLF